MKFNIRKIIAVLSAAAVICAGGCADNTEPEEASVSAQASVSEAVTENTATTQLQTEAPVTEVEKTVDYSKEIRTVEVPYDGGYTAIFGFNANNNILRSENIPWGRGNTYYTYDGEGRLTETAQHNDSDCVEKKVYSYDKNGNNSKIDTYHDGELVEYAVFEYDENGNKISEASYYAGGNLQYEETYEYDSDGNLIEEADDSIVYEYDDNGNILSETVDGIKTDYVYENGLLVKKLRNGETLVEYAYFDNNNIVRVYWYENENTIGEINIALYSEVFAG